jgi:hypothetical protein
MSACSQPCPRAAAMRGRGEKGTGKRAPGAVFPAADI